MSMIYSIAFTDKYFYLCWHLTIYTRPYQSLNIFDLLRILLILYNIGDKVIDVFKDFLNN